MFVVLYRSKVKPGMEQQFEQGWRHLTIAIREQCGSYGSRLHRGDDGIYYAYAMWPSSQARDDCAAAGLHLAPEAANAMHDAIQEDLPEIRMNLVIDEARDARQ